MNLIEVIALIITVLIITALIITALIRQGHGSRSLRAKTANPQWEGVGCS